VPKVRVITEPGKKVPRKQKAKGAMFTIAPLSSPRNRKVEIVEPRGGFQIIVVSAEKLAVNVVPINIE
jgi:hypothetical protein